MSGVTYQVVHGRAAAAAAGIYKVRVMVDWQQRKKEHTAKDKSSLTLQACNQTVLLIVYHFQCVH